LPDQTPGVWIKTRLPWGCKKSGAGVHLRLVLGSCGQPADLRNDPRLQAFRRSKGQTNAAVKTRENTFTMEVLYQLS
jgi:hypothetical protein